MHHQRRVDVVGQTVRVDRFGVGIRQAARAVVHDFRHRAERGRLALSHAIYKADINFEPVIHGIYHVYQKDDGTQVLSMVAPYEWGKNAPYTFLNTVRLLADRTWEILA